MVYENEDRPPEAPEPSYLLPNYRPLTEDECRRMAAGDVPAWLADICRGMIEFSLQTGRLDYVGRRLLQQARGTGTGPVSSSRRVMRPGEKASKRKSKTRGRIRSTSAGRGSKR